jgi:hypothetical protein
VRPATAPAAVALGDWRSGLWRAAAMRPKRQGDLSPLKTAGCMWLHVGGRLSLLPRAPSRPSLVHSYHSAARLEPHPRSAKGVAGEVVQRLRSHHAMWLQAAPARGVLVAMAALGWVRAVGGDDDDSTEPMVGAAAGRGPDEKPGIGVGVQAGGGVATAVEAAAGRGGREAGCQPARKRARL